MVAWAVLWETPSSLVSQSRNRHLENVCGLFTQNPVPWPLPAAFHSKCSVLHHLPRWFYLFQNQRPSISIAVIIRIFIESPLNVTYFYKHFLCIIEFNPPNQHRKKALLCNWDIKRLHSWQVTQTIKSRTRAGPPPSCLLPLCDWLSPPASMSKGCFPEPLTLEVFLRFLVPTETDSGRSPMLPLFKLALSLFWKVFAGTQSQGNPILNFSSNYPTPGTSPRCLLPGRQW